MKSIVFKNIKDMTSILTPDWKFFLVLIFIDNPFDYWKEQS